MGYLSKSDLCLNCLQRDPLKLKPRHELAEASVVNGSVSFTVLLDDHPDLLARVQLDQRDLCPIGVSLPFKETHHRCVDVVPRHVLRAGHPAVNEKLSAWTREAGLRERWAKVTQEGSHCSRAIANMHMDMPERNRWAARQRRMPTSPDGLWRDACDSDKDGCPHALLGPGLSFLSAVLYPCSVVPNWGHECAGVQNLWILKADDERYTRLQPINFLQSSRYFGLYDSFREAFYGVLEEPAATGVEERIRSRVPPLLGMLRSSS